MKRALHGSCWVACWAACLALLASGCGPSFWSEVQYFDGRQHLTRALPESLVGHSRAWVIENLGEPDEIDTGSSETLIYRGRDFDLLELQRNDQTVRDDSLLTTFLEGTRFVRGMNLVVVDGMVRSVNLVVYRPGRAGQGNSLLEIISGQPKSWIIGQLGPPDVILPRMGGDTFVYRDRTLDLWVLRVRPTLTNYPAIYTRAEGTRYIQRLNVYFDRDGSVRNVSFPQRTP